MFPPFRPRFAFALLLIVATAPAGFAGEDAERKSRRLLLLGQSPDNHAWSQHEYMAAAKVLAGLLQDVPDLQTIVENADEPWERGPELLDGADGAVVFLSEGAKWLGSDAKRLAAFRELAERGGGLVVLHWGMGTRDAEHVEPFVELFGGCHGGPDRKYKVVDVKAEIAAPGHPIVRGIEPFEVHEEFYYRLKFPGGRVGETGPNVTPLLRVPIDGAPHTVAWAYERPDGGRSFGFSGLHFHRNWAEEPYRRMITQAVLWTLKRPVPENLSLKVDPELIAKPRPKPSE